jgi:hypothetical protein
LLHAVSSAQVSALNEKIGAAIARLEGLEAIGREFLREAMCVARSAAEMRLEIGVSSAEHSA